MRIAGNFVKVFVLTVFLTVSTEEVFSEVPKTSVPFDMVTIPAGTYRVFLAERKALGAALSFPEIQIKSFELDRFPVSNQQFLSFLTTHPNWQRSQASRLFVDSAYLKHWAGDLDLGNVDRESPVVYVSWFAARAYCQCLGKRLPTTNEWEYAAAPTQFVEDGRDAEAVILEWYGRPTPSQLPKLGSSLVSKLGVHDLHGLVWEWTQDFNSAMIGDDGRKGSSSERGFFCGAGALGSLDPAAYATFMRVAFRSSLKGGFALGQLGFRCAK